METKLDDTTQDNEILPPNYNIPSNDRKRSGSGVLMASKDNINSESLLEFDTAGKIQG